MTRVAWPASLVIGLVLMLAFEDALTRVLGLLCLATFIVLGVFAIARPEFLEESQEEDGVLASPTRREE
jgi:hypothetical protein